MEMEPSDRYTFISAESSVDYIRIVREAPQGTQFILVQKRDRFIQRATGWVLLVHKALLEDERIYRHYLAGEAVSEGWGDDNANGKTLYSYRFVEGQGKFPGELRGEVERIKKLLSEKDTLTTVEYK